MLYLVDGDIHRWNENIIVQMVHNSEQEACTVTVWRLMLTLVFFWADALCLEVTHVTQRLRWVILVLLLLFCTAEAVHDERKHPIFKDRAKIFLFNLNSYWETVTKNEKVDGHWRVYLGLSRASHPQDTFGGWVCASVAEEWRVVLDLFVL